MKEHINWLAKFKVSKYKKGEKIPYEVLEFKKNLLLTVGATEFWSLITGDSSDHFDNTYATIGVGDSTTIAAIAQTDLVAASNKTYVGMEATYPAISGNEITFRSVFTTSDANYAWNEFVIKQSDSGKVFNRKVYSCGTKTDADTWTVDVYITIS